MREKVIKISILVFFVVLFEATSSGQTPYGSFTQLEYHEFPDGGGNPSIEGFCYGGGYLWAMDWPRTLIKIDPAVGIVWTKVILDEDCYGAVCYENGTLWVATRFHKILPFDTDGNSLGGGISFHDLPDPFSGEIRGIIKEDDGFWLFEYWTPMIFKIDMSGNLIKNYPNAWLCSWPSTIAKYGNKIYKLTGYYSLSNDWDFNEAMAMDLETGHVTDSWEYPDESDDPIGLSAGDNCFWSLGHDIVEDKFTVRKLSVPDPSPPPDIPSTQWGDFVIKSWGYPPIKPSMIEGLYGFGYDRMNKELWLGDGIAGFFMADDIGEQIFPMIHSWHYPLGYALAYDFAFHNNTMWIVQWWRGVSLPKISRVEKDADDNLNILEEWEVGMDTAAGLATDGNYLWVSGRETAEVTGLPYNDIRKFDLSGNLITHFDYDENNNYEDLAWHKGGLWAINNKITELEIHNIDPDTGTVLHAYEGGGSVNFCPGWLWANLASDGESLLTFAPCTNDPSDSYRSDHFCLLRIQLPSDQVRDDLLGTWSTGVWYRNSETGSWVKMTTPAQMVAAGDVDGDGIDDLAGVWSSGLWVKYSSSGSWAKLSTTLPTDIASGDMSGDGRDDVLGTWPSGVWYRNTDTGSWVKMTTPAQMVAAGDLDGDGTVDLIGVWSSGLWVKYSGTSSWLLITPVLPIGIAIGDMNGDGRDDILGTWSSGVWYRNSVGGSWVKMSIPANLVAAGDIDGDGTDDLIGNWSSGLWVKNSSTTSWKFICTSLPSDMDTGLFRGGAWDAGAIGYLEPIGGYAEGPWSGDYIDFSDEAPGGINFVYQKEENLIPQDTDAQKARIPGPEEPGFKGIEQKNLVPLEELDTKKRKRRF